MGNLAGTLGVGGVAIGFAFKDIFQNFLAGILLLLTKPFNVGDQIIFRSPAVDRYNRTRTTRRRLGSGKASAPTVAG